MKKIIYRRLLTKPKNLNVILIINNSNIKLSYLKTLAIAYNNKINKSKSRSKLKKKCLKNILTPKYNEQERKREKKVILYEWEIKDFSKQAKCHFELLSLFPHPSNIANTC